MKEGTLWCVLILGSQQGCGGVEFPEGPNCFACWKLIGFRIPMPTSGDCCKPWHLLENHNCGWEGGGAYLG